MTRILIIDGHPDTDPVHFIHAAASAYAEGAAGRHEVRRIEVAGLNFPLLRSPAEWMTGVPNDDIRAAQEAISWAQHVVILYPLWLGDLPALLKGFLEQVARPGFAMRYRHKGLPEKLLTGKSARVIVSMGMPGFAYSLLYRAHSLKSLERNILRFVGFGPVRHTIIGAVQGSAERRGSWLQRLHAMGARAA